MFSSRLISLAILFSSVIVVLVMFMSPSTNNLVVRASGDHHGIATFYIPNGGTGACGSPIQNSDNAVALSTGEFQGGNLCGKTITVTDTSNGRSVSGVVIQDLCEGCQDRDGNKNNIDLTSGVFQQLDSLSVGEINGVFLLNLISNNLISGLES